MSASLAPVFAALGDPTRLALVEVLGEGRPRSITQLAQGRPQTRQAVTKHLAHLEAAGLVRRVRRGRETLFELEPAPLADLGAYLDAVGRQWAAKLGDLQAYLGEGAPPAVSES